MPLPNPTPDQTGKRARFLQRTVGTVNQMLAMYGGLQAMVTEGQVAGYLPDTSGQASAPLTDSDFSGPLAYLNAASFLAAVQALQQMQADLAANKGTPLAALFQLKN